MYRLKYINQEIFGIAFGIFFSFPTSTDLFLQYVAPVMLKESSNPTIPFGIVLISLLVFVGTWLAFFDVIKKYHKMRGVITGNHIRNMVFAVILGSVTGIIVHNIVF